MGLGKKLSAGHVPRSTGGLGSLGVSNVAQGGFVNIGVDMREIERKFEHLRKAIKDEEEQLKIHRKVAKVAKKFMQDERIAPSWCAFGAQASRAASAGLPTTLNREPSSVPSSRGKSDRKPPCG